MELETTPNRGLVGKLEVQITPNRFPTITEACLADAAFQKLIAENLERVVEEYLTAAEGQVAAAKSDTQPE